MSHFIACRLTSYGQYQERAWTDLPALGIRHVEIHVPADTAAMRRKLAQHGLVASSVQARCDIASPDVIESMRPQLAAVADLGAKICLVALQPVAIPRDIVIERLRQIGVLAQKEGVVLALETHPDLLHNAAAARRSLASINHPNVRINFDTGNVYFYNQGLEAISELRELLAWTGSLHLKDTFGGYQQRPFPALGEGVIDFARVFHELAQFSFSGPCTIELDTKGLEMEEAAQLDMVRRSVEYLVRIGAMTQ